MGIVTGRNMTMYTGDGMRIVGCEDTCTITTTNELIVTKTVGSGKFRNREYGTSDVTISCSGVVFMNAAFDGAGTNLDPVEFLAYSLQGKKAVVKYQITDGTTTKFLIGNFLILSCVYTGSANDFSTYQVELAIDGKLYASDALISRALYDGPSVVSFNATSDVDGFTDVRLENASTIYFIHRSGNGFNKVYQTSEIQTLTLSSDIPTGTNTVGFHAGSGTVNFEDDLNNNDVVIVSYDTSD